LDQAWALTLREMTCLQTLSAAEQDRLRVLVDRFLRSKSLEGAAGLQISDAMRVAIGAQACLLVLNLGLDYYDGWKSIIVYPGNFRVERKVVDASGVMHIYFEELAGEAWESGPVVLSWQHIEQSDQRHANVVLHEFAHKIDMLNGAANGFPPLHTGMDTVAWSRDFRAAFTTMQQRLWQGDLPPIDDYAAHDPAEFFAVMSEVFFQTPHVVHREFPAVYGHLRDFYRQDPLARWMARQAPMHGKSR
jgi:Mlc titration factor MtfA (ptsG expression regulator)